MLKNLNIKYLTALLLGIATIFAFAPFNLFPLAVLSIMGLIFIWQNQSPKQSFVLGLLFGIGHFGSGVWWVYISIHGFGNSPWPIAILLTSLLILILSLYPALVGLIINKFWKKNSIVKWCLVFPAIWTLGEWLRSILFSGFPWLSLGYSQMNSPLRGVAPIVGIYGISFLVVLSAGLMWVLFKGLSTNRFARISILVTIISIWTGTYLCTHLHWYKPIDTPLSVSLIQGDIPQDVKWDPDQLQTNIDIYRKLTFPHLGENLIIWPEAAIPAPLWYAEPSVDLIDATAKRFNTSLLTGIEHQDEQHNYNTLLALGDSQGIYYKRHLVPFGEYLPFEKLIRGIIHFFNLPMSDLSSGPKVQDNITVHHAEVAPFICYEIAFPGLVRHSLPDANILTTISDDSWFGESIALDQHLQIAQMRALETGRPLLFASNNGITAIVNADGKVTSRLPIAQPDVLTTNVQPMTGTTPFVFYGELPLLLLCGILLLVGVRNMNI